MPTTTYYDPLGNPPLLDILSFMTTKLTDAIWLRIYKRVVVGDPSQDVEVETIRLPNRVTDWYPYYHVLYNAERSVQYVITYLDSEGVELLAPENRIAAENYFPPVPRQDAVLLNQPKISCEWLRRDYIVLEQMGERAILLRRKRSGVHCDCWRDEDRKALPRCKVCYGTGWVDGYDVFYPFLIDFQPAGERLQITSVGLVMDNQPRGWGVIVPQIADGDYVVRLWNQKLDRYELNNPTRTGRDGVGGIPTIQEFSLRLHDSDHPIYRFPVEKFVSDYTPPESHFGLQETT